MKMDAAVESTGMAIENESDTAPNYDNMVPVGANNVQNTDSNETAQQRQEYIEQTSLDEEKEQDCPDQQEQDETQQNDQQHTTPHPPNKSKKDQFEHRHYFAFHPTCNKLLAKRWEDHTRDLHYKRLRQAKPSIDNSPPRVYPHLEMRLKRLQIEEGECFT
jgi:cobalamin biosynthesis protein CobT